MRPSSAVLEESVGEGDKLSRDGCDGDLGRFPGGDERLILAFMLAFGKHPPKTR